MLLEEHMHCDLWPVAHQVFYSGNSQTSQAAVSAGTQLLCPEEERQLGSNHPVSSTTAFFLPIWPEKSQCREGANLLTFSGEDFTKTRYILVCLLCVYLCVLYMCACWSQVIKIVSYLPILFRVYSCYFWPEGTCQQKIWWITQMFPMYHLP